jgi:diacylglycerol kinase (ATP)
MSIKIGVVSNTHSGRNKAALGQIQALLRDHPQVRNMAFHDISELVECLHEMAAAGITHLVVSGGDGTVQAAVSHLLNDKPFAEMPRLSLLSAGKTNCIAADVGIVGPPAVSLKRLIERVEAGEEGQRIDRPVLTLDLGDDGPLIHGFLLGAIAFYQGTIQFRPKVTGLGLQPGLQSMLGILLSVWRTLRYGPGSKSGFHGERVGVTVDGEKAGSQELFVLVATTLTQILPGIRPFWGRGEGRMQLTTVVHPPRRLFWAIWPALRGRPRKWMEQLGYHSRRAEKLEVEMTSPVVLDGEIFETDGGSGIKVSVGPTMAFYRY